MQNTTNIKDFGMNSNVKTVFNAGSACPPYISQEIWYLLNRSKTITVIHMNNLFGSDDLAYIGYKMYRDIYITDGMMQFMKIILREKNTIESPSRAAIIKWVEVST